MQLLNNFTNGDTVQSISPSTKILKTTLGNIYSRYPPISMSTDIKRDKRPESTPQVIFTECHSSHPACHREIQVQKSVFQNSQTPGGTVNRNEESFDNDPK